MQKRNTMKNIQQLFFRAQMILIVSLALFLGVAGILVNIHFEREKRDQNLQNVAETIAQSPILEESPGKIREYLDSLKETLGDIDVISVVDKESVRVYHSNNDLIDTVYDGTMPEFNTKKYYTADETGPSGTQRRAYAAIYAEDGAYKGFVMAIMLMENIRSEIGQMLLIFLLITVVAILLELLISARHFRRMKESLLGYEPDVFTAMYKMRDNILESLDEGIVAKDKEGTVQFANEAANRMLSAADTAAGDLLIDRIPIKEDDAEIGTIEILHDRAEYTKLMEDLAGTRYLVDSMRANNHDFTNKLHVILGLLQMEMYDEATSYIQNITMVQRSTISKIMNAVSEPAVAALLIGKTARASELNIRFVLREGCTYSGADMNLPAEVLVTVIGNLIDNAFEAMNESADYETEKELLFGIYSRPGAVLITADDTGMGISEADMEHIFENGYSTKGEGRGTGLYQVKTMVEQLGGKITVESQVGVGTSFSISFTREN